MEAVTADTVLFIPLVGQGVYVGFLVEVRIEGGIEYADVGLIRQYCLTSRNTLERGGTVERVYRDDGFDVLYLLFAKEAGFAELAAVSEAVTYRTYLVNA